MINVLSAITQTGEQRACHIEFRMLVQYHWWSKDLSYHLYEHYYSNLVKTWKSLTYLGIHFCHLRLDIVVGGFLLKAKRRRFWEALEISRLKKVDNSRIWAPERNIGAWFHKLLRLNCLKLSHSSQIYIYYGLQLWLLPLPKPSDYSFLFYLMESKEKVYCFNSQPYALRTIQSAGTCFVSKDFLFNQSMLFEGPNMCVINL